MNGRRKAPRWFLDWVALQMKEMGLEQCPQMPCFFRGPEPGQLVEVHMDDFHGTGPGAWVEWFLGEWGNGRR